MMTRFLPPVIALAALMSGAVSCVYPFEVSVPSEDARLTVDGSIRVGAQTVLTLSRVIPLNGGGDYSLSFEGFIEGEDGSRVTGVPALVVPVAEEPSAGMAPPHLTLTFDTSALSDAQRYRLFLRDTGHGAEYASDWLTVHPAPVIDDLSYTPNQEEGRLDIAMTMHGGGGNRFRWSFEETWEYHADMQARYYFDPSRIHVSGEYKPEMGIVPFPPGQNIYYCWRRYTSPGIRIFSTADQAEDRFTDLSFHQVARTDQRLQILYRLTVYLEALDEQGYNYWHNIEQNSQNQGSIFSPMPSQMTGNIHCLTDPSAEVLGYVNAAKVAVAELYYDNGSEHFYQAQHRTIEVVNAQPESFETLYGIGYVPYDFFAGSQAEPPAYQWLPRQCVDCRMQGGSKDKPEGWPNDHQ
ncbi:MAG: DUF4249 family protein [Bacteroidales bacterium]|nr:DUF4249 family protein [Bacteroidales bacterium]